MPETVARNSVRGPATAGTVETVHLELDRLWARAGYVPDTDRRAFTLAVVEATTNAVLHAVPATAAPIELKVDIAAHPLRLEASIYEIGAAPSQVELDPPLPATDGESGRGLAMIHALVSRVVLERHGNRNVWKLCRECGGDRP